MRSFIVYSAWHVGELVTLMYRFTQETGESSIAKFNDVQIIVVKDSFDKDSEEHPSWDKKPKITTL